MIDLTCVEHTEDMFEGFEGEIVNEIPCNHEPEILHNKKPNKWSPWLSIDKEKNKIINWYYGESIGADFKINGKILFPEIKEYIDIPNFMINKIIELVIITFDNVVIYSKLYNNLPEGKIPLTLNPTKSGKIPRGTYKLELRVYSHDNFEDMFSRWTEQYLDNETGLSTEYDREEYPNIITSSIIGIMANKEYLTMGTQKNAKFFIYDVNQKFSHIEEGESFVWGIEDGFVRICYEQGLTQTEKGAYKFVTKLYEGDTTLNKVLVWNTWINVVVH